MNNLGSKGFISVPSHSPSLRNVMINDSKSGQKPQDRSCGRGHGGVLLAVLLPMACSACTPQDHFPRDGTIHNGLGLPTSITSSESALETCLQTDLKKVAFQLRGSLFPDYLCQADTRLARTRYQPPFWGGRQDTTGPKTLSVLHSTCFRCPSDFELRGIGFRDDPTRGIFTSFGNSSVSSGFVFLPTEELQPPSLVVGSSALAEKSQQRTRISRWLLVWISSLGSSLPHQC